MALSLGLPPALEARALPEQWGMRGPHKYITRALCVVIIGFGLCVVPADPRLDLSSADGQNQGPG